MSRQADESFDVFAVVNTIQADVVSAAHPTEARNLTYQPPFRHTFISDATLLPTEDSVLQQVGTAQLQDDGSYRIYLTDEIPHSKLLILRPHKANN